MSKILKLIPTITKRYESKLDRYFFYNNLNGKCWDTDSTIGAVVAALDGSLTLDEIIDTISSNTVEVPRGELKIQFNKIFDFLEKEGFIYECSR